jgi:hypothetical protein
MFDEFPGQGPINGLLLVGKRKARKEPDAVDSRARIRRIDTEATLEFALGPIAEPS